MGKGDEGRTAKVKDRGILLWEDYELKNPPWLCMCTCVSLCAFALNGVRRIKSEFSLPNIEECSFNQFIVNVTFFPNDINQVRKLKVAEFAFS